MITLLTFDLDDTLWDVKSIVVRAEKTMQAWIREHHTDFSQAFTAADFLSVRMAVLQERKDIAHDFTQLRLEVLRRAFTQGGYSTASAEAAAQGAYEVFEHQRNTVEFFGGALAALAELKKDFLLFALSNGTADIHRVGLGDIFSQQFSAISVGAAKPNPRMFLAALQAAGVAPEHAIHIGDHPEQDIQAAAAVGMKTVWANFLQQPWPLADAAAPLHSFDDFLALPALIKKISAQP